MTKKRFSRSFDDYDVIGGSKCPFYQFFPKIFRKSPLIAPFYQIGQNICQKWIPRKKIRIPGIFKIVSTPIIALMGSKNVFSTLGQKTENHEKRSKRGPLGVRNNFK